MFIIDLDMGRLNKGIEKVFSLHLMSINLATDFHFLWNSRSHYKCVIALKFMGFFAAVQPIWYHLKSCFTPSQQF